MLTRQPAVNSLIFETCCENIGSKPNWLQCTSYVTVTIFPKSEIETQHLMAGGTCEFGTTVKRSWESWLHTSG